MWGRLTRRFFGGSPWVPHCSGEGSFGASRPLTCRSRTSHSISATTGVDWGFCFSFYPHEDGRWEKWCHMNSFCFFQRTSWHPSYSVTSHCDGFVAVDFLYSAAACRSEKSSGLAPSQWIIMTSFYRTLGWRPAGPAWPGCGAFPENGESPSSRGMVWMSTSLGYKWMMTWGFGGYPILGPPPKKRRLRHFQRSKRCCFWQAQSGLASLPIWLEIRAVLLAAFDHHRRHSHYPRFAPHALQELLLRLTWQDDMLP